MNDIVMGNRIRDMREARGMSASDLARILDVTPSAVWNWEKNGVTPRPDMLNSIARAFGVNVESIVNGARDDLESRKSVADVIEGAKGKIAELLDIPLDRIRVFIEVSSA